MLYGLMPDSRALNSEEYGMLNNADSVDEQQQTEPEGIPGRFAGVPVSVSNAP